MIWVFFCFTERYYSIKSIRSLKKFKYENIKGWWKAMTPRELADITIEDIIIRRLKAENDFYGYKTEKNIKRRKNSSMSLGGCRW